MFLENGRWVVLDLIQDLSFLILSFIENIQFTVKLIFTPGIIAIFKRHWILDIRDYVVNLSNSNQYLKVVFSRKYKQIDSNNN